jgi:D-alanyl-D-alanine carboxypeptidase
MFKIIKILTLSFFLLILLHDAKADEIKDQFHDKNISQCSDNYSSLVYDATNYDVILEDRSEKNIYPASLVKLMTVYLTFEAIKKGLLKLDDVIFFSKRGEEVSKINKITTLNIAEGDSISVEQAIRGTIIKSFNEAAVVLAEAVSGSEWNFVRLMNKKAKEIGMLNSSFRNATGLHESGQYTTAYDLARLVRALKEDFPQFYHYFSQKTFSFNDKEFTTHNHVLLEYEGAEGLKTGFTRASGFNLISAAKNNQNHLISILANCSTWEKRDQQTKDMLDYLFVKYDKNNKMPIRTKINHNFSYSDISPKAEISTKENKNRIGSISSY